MANEFYDHTTYPSTGASGSSSAMRAELNAIEAGFDKLPTMAGNGGEIIAVNSGATALEAITTTGTGSGVRATSPTLVTPILGTPTSGTLTNCTGLPVSTGIAGMGTGVATALTVNVGSAGSPVVNGGALGTPSGGTLTNCSGLPASAVVNTPAGSIAASDVQTAINELDTEKAALAGSASQAFAASTLSAATTIGVGAATPAASGAGITFPATQSASSDANTLDDYEEGTWTPTITGATVVGTPTYAGHYTKIGRLVRFVLYITSTTSFESTARTICYFNLPFAPVASAVGIGVLSATNAGSNAEYGQNTIASNDRAYLPVIPATSDIIVTGEYFTT